jgi:hypothetical protein
MRPAPHRARALAAAALALAVLWLHLAGLQAWRAGAAAPPPPPALQVRSVAAAPVPRPVAATPAQSAPSRPPPTPGAPQAAPANPRADSPLAAPPRLRGPRPAEETKAASDVPADDARDADRPAAVAAGRTTAGSQAAAEPLPVYPTRLPDAFRWTYRVERGARTAGAALVWGLEGGRYDLRFDTEPAGAGTEAPLRLSWRSEGVVDHAGVAPERFVVRAGGRGAQAANFRRDDGRITYSGPQAEHALPAGVQDRLSWLVQLAAILEADATLASAGARIDLAVGGARGELDRWRFEVDGLRAVETPAGPVEALLLRREPTRAYDTRGEVWLDPRRQHLPVAVELSTVDAAGRTVDLLALRLAHAP